MSSENSTISQKSGNEREQSPLAKKLKTAQNSLETNLEFGVNQNNSDNLNIINSHSIRAVS
jgi:hypothetical protein